jgi:hypothetical protein
MLLAAMRGSLGMLPCSVVVLNLYVFGWTMLRNHFVDITAHFVAIWLGMFRFGLRFGLFCTFSAVISVSSLSISVF